MALILFKNAAPKVMPGNFSTPEKSVYLLLATRNRSVYLHDPHYNKLLWCACVLIIQCTLAV